MVEKWDITIPELTGSQTRRAYLYLPDYYDDTPDERYPVLYMFDGHNVFFDSHATYGKSWGMKEYMDQTKTPLIIAAVECNHSPNNGRLEEYSPFDFSDSSFGFVKGRGQTTMECMIHSFKKEIDSRFRTLPGREHTFIAGSSMGGLMSLYAVLEYNHIFSRAAALSPSISLVSPQIERFINKSRPGADTVIYMDYGSEEMDTHQGMPQCFSRVTSLFINKPVMLESRVIPGGTHCEASWERQIPFFLNTLLYGL